MYRSFCTVQNRAGSHALGATNFIVGVHSDLRMYLVILTFVRTSWIECALTQACTCFTLVQSVRSALHMRACVLSVLHFRMERSTHVKLLTFVLV